MPGAHRSLRGKSNLDRLRYDLRGRVPPVPLEDGVPVPFEDGVQSGVLPVLGPNGPGRP